MSSSGKMIKRLPLALITILIIILSLLIFIALQQENRLVSPAKKGLTLGVNQWFPQNVLGDSAPQISAKAALFVDTENGEVLVSKNAKERLPIASLTKVMTAVVTLEHLEMDDSLKVSQGASSMEPDKMLLIPGETLTIRELLYGIFLISANDAAEVLAEEVTGNRDEFIQLMNEKATQLGMKDTLFVNPTGLDEDSGNSYSTAFDLALLSRYAIRNYPQLVEISKTEHIILPRTDTHQDYDMYSGINLLTTYPGVLGFKTGYTPQAGLTIITLAVKNEHQVLGILLGSENRREETRTLLDYSFEKLE